jgi:hypothetical protein
MAPTGITLADVIHRIEEAAPGAQAIERLELAVEAAGELAALSDALLDHFVEECRDDATSWARIGEALGVSKQGAQQRFVPRQTDLEGFARTPEFTRWTPRARAALQHAVDETARLGQGFVGTEHLLLGVLDGENLAVVALDALGADNVALRDALLARIGSHQPVPGDGLPFTPLARRALDRTLREALRLGHNYVGTEHLLIALAESEGLAAEVLHEAEVDADGIRREIIRLLSRYRKGD